MINWCLEHAGHMGNALVQFRDTFMEGLGGRRLFDSALFWACFQAILFIDTLLFTLGYILETPALRNRIRSVDPTFFGWFICLACYPPFNGITSRLFEWQSSDFPQFQGDIAHFVANITLLAALAVYSWASIALGFKASNLTNRGIVSRGPYSLIRHPAYTAKNPGLVDRRAAQPVSASHGGRLASLRLRAVCAHCLDRHLWIARHHRGAPPAHGKQRLRRLHEAGALAFHPGCHLANR